MLVVPASTLEEHSIDVHSIFRSLLMISLLWQANELKADGVYWNSVLACKILQNSCQESMCEEEATEPEFHRWAIVHPTLEHVEPIHEIIEVAAKWFHCWVADWGP